MKKSLALILILIGSTKYVYGDYPQPPGLENCRNTCFLNSIIQCLWRVTPFEDQIKKIPLPQQPFLDENKKGLGLFIRLCLDKDTYNSGKVVPCTGTLKSFVDQVYTKIMGVDPFTQQDATQLLMSLFTMLENATNESKNITDNFFKMKLFQRITAPNITGFKAIERSDNYYMLDLKALEDDTGTVVKTLGQALNNFFSLETLDTPLTGYTSSQGPFKKQFFLENEPPYIVLNIGRYKTAGSGATYTVEKIDNPIDIPFDLDLSLIGNNIFRQLTIQREGYHLIAFAQHLGNIKGGHYVAGVKENNTHWYICNDSTITEISPTDQQFIQSKNTSYLYIYERNDISSPPPPMPPRPPQQPPKNNVDDIYVLLTDLRNMLINIRKLIV